jgi:hypothetical protein
MSLSKALRKSAAEAAARAKECDDIIVVIRSTTWSGSEEIVQMIKRRSEAYKFVEELD